LRRVGGIPIAGEDASTLIEVQRMFAAGAVDFIQPVRQKMAGISELRKVMALANANNVPVMVHTFYNGPGLLASIHATAAPGEDASMIEWRYFDMAAQLYSDAVLPRDRYIAVPEGPGLGLDPEPAVISRYRLS